MRKFTRFLALFLVAILFVQVLPASAAGAEDQEILESAEAEQAHVEPEQPEEDAETIELTEAEQLEENEVRSATRGTVVDDPTPLVLGSNDFVIEDTHVTVFRPFTPTETSYYHFFSTVGVGEDTLNGFLQDSDRNTLAMDDPCPDYFRDFTIFYKLVAGVTYYFGVNSFYETRTVPVTIQKIDNACGDNLTWAYDDSNKTLTISGTGAMWDFTGSMPWIELREEIETIVLPEGITCIGDYAFFGCVSTKEIEFPDSVTSIGDAAFLSCSGFASITIPESVTRIGSSAFERCSGLTSITVPGNLTYLGDYAFCECEGLKTAKLWSIGPCMLSYCSNLETVIIENTVTSISPEAFELCLGLKEIEIPDSVTTIEFGAFLGCKGLTAITIPVSMRTIEDYAFDNCSGLADVYYLGTIEQRMNNLKIENDYYHHNAYLINATWHYLTVESIEMKTLPDKLTYLEGEELDVTGGKITMYYDNDIVKEEILTIDMVSGFDNTKAGKQTLTVTFEDQTTTFDVTVSHIPGEPVRENEVAPTCTEAGHYDEVVYCTECHEELSREEKSIPANGHTPGKPVRENEVAATTTAEGHYDEVVYCTVCHAELSREQHKTDKLPTPKFDGTVTLNPNDVQLNGKTPYRVYNGKAQTPGVIVKDKNGKMLAASQYTVSYRNNTKPGTAYADVTIKSTGAKVSVWFKIYLPATTSTTVKNVGDIPVDRTFVNGIQISWKKVEGAKGYVIYRRAWNLKSKGWTKFERWNNTTKTTWIDTKVYPGTRYQYGIKAYFSDPMDNYNLGLVGPLKTTVYITKRELNNVFQGIPTWKVKWSASSLFTGYQLQIANDSNFTQNVKTITIKDPKKNTYTFKGLKGRTWYYLRVRSYHIFDGTTYYGAWSDWIGGRSN